MIKKKNTQITYYILGLFVIILIIILIYSYFQKTQLVQFATCGHWECHYNPNKPHDPGPTIEDYIISILGSAGQEYDGQKIEDKCFEVVTGSPSDFQSQCNSYLYDITGNQNYISSCEAKWVEVQCDYTYTQQTPPTTTGGGGGGGGGEKPNPCRDNKDKKNYCYPPNKLNGDITTHNEYQSTEELTCEAVAQGYVGGYFYCDYKCELQNECNKGCCEYNGMFNLNDLLSMGYSYNQLNAMFQTEGQLYPYFDPATDCNKFGKDDCTSDGRNILCVFNPDVKDCEHLSPPPVPESTPLPECSPDQLLQQWLSQQGGSQQPSSEDWPPGFEPTYPEMPEITEPNPPQISEPLPENPPSWISGGSGIPEPEPQPEWAPNYWPQPIPPESPDYPTQHGSQPAPEQGPCLGDILPTLPQWLQGQIQHR